MPGAIIAGGVWIAGIVWLLYEMWRAPLLDDDEMPLGHANRACERRHHQDLGILLATDGWRVPHERRHG